MKWSHKNCICIQLIYKVHAGFNYVFRNKKKVYPVNMKKRTKDIKTHIFYNL